MKTSSQQGLAKLIALIVVAVLLLSYFGINIQKITESDAGKANFGYVWQLTQQVGAWLANLYQQYLAQYLQPILKYLPF